MVQKTNEPIGVIQRSDIGRSVDAWAVLAENTPVFASGDASAAARVAAAILDDARKIRREYEEQMASADVDSNMLELHEYVHDAERYGLAAQRHGVECLTARLRGDTLLVEQISAETFEKTQLASEALGNALNLVEGVPTPGEVPLEMPPEVPRERIDVVDDPESERRQARAHRARRLRPIPEKSPPVTQPRQYSLTQQPPWPPRNPRPKLRLRETEAAESPPPIPTIEPPVQSVSTDVIVARELSTPDSSQAAQLEVLATSRMGVKDSTAQMWLYRGLVVVLVALIAIGLWLLLSDNSFIG